MRCLLALTAALSWPFAAFSGSVSRGFSVDCSDFTRDKVAAVAVAFEYKGRQELAFTKNDQAFYHSKIGTAVSSSAKTISNKDLKGQKKKAFLELLARQIGNKKKAVFSYSGHAIRANNKSWALLLPSLPEELSMACAGQLSLFAGGPEPTVETKPPARCAEVADYVVTDHDLRGVFGDRDVLVMNDSCFSGGADFGPKAVTISSSLADQASQEKQGVKGVDNGRFTHRLKQRFAQCELDVDQDGRLNAAEFTVRFAVAKPGTTTENFLPQPKTVAVSQWLNDQSTVDKGARTLLIRSRPVESHQRATINRTAPWLQCLDFGASECPRNGSSSDSEEGRP